MRTLFAASTLALFAAVPLLACSSSNPLNAEDTSTTSEALARRGDLDPLPRKPVTVDAGAPDTGTHDAGYRGPFGNIQVPNVGVLSSEIPPPCSPDERFDLRRKTRTCEDLPNAYVENGVTFVPGNGGRFRVGRLLTGTTAPPSLQNRACIYTWENAGSCAAPDKAKLLVEATEDLSARPSICVTNPAACVINNTLPATHPPHAVPNGPGRCEVCGLATNRSLWVVLPPQWRAFEYQLAGEQVSHFVFLDELPNPPAPTDDVVVLEVALPTDVAEQDVEIDPAVN
jgi:hypothetical protein